MQIKATNINDAYQSVTFTWNDDLSECNYVALGVEDDQIDQMIANKVHEGCDFGEWVTSID